MKQISQQELDVISIQLSEAVDCLSDLILDLCIESDKDGRSRRDQGIISRLSVISRDLQRSTGEIEEMVNEALLEQETEETAPCCCACQS